MDKTSVILKCHLLSAMIYSYLPVAAKTWPATAYFMICPVLTLTLQFHTSYWFPSCKKWVSEREIGCLTSHATIFQLYIKRDFYSDVYTILNMIQLTKWTICAFQVLNPRQWFLAKQCSLKNGWKSMPKKCLNSTSTQKGWCNKPRELKKSFLNTKNFDALQTLQINRSRL